MIIKLRDDYGTTIFLTTHLMDEADALCDRIGIMNKSHLISLGMPSELKEKAGVGSLDDAFIKLTGDAIDTGGNYRDIQRDRKTAQRLG